MLSAAPFNGSRFAGWCFRWRSRERSRLASSGYTAWSARRWFLIAYLSKTIGEAWQTGAHWREKEHFDRDAILFTCVGRLEPQKNPLLLLQAFAALKDPRIHLIMMGEGSLREQLATYIREHGLERRVHLLGKRNEVPECLAASDVFVLSSNWEGNPLAVMEAMAAGLPVVGTTVGGIPELVESGQQGILVPPGDCAAFTDAMRTLLNDPEKRAAMGNAARVRATAAFNVERMAQGYESIYRAALAASGLANDAAAA